MQAGATSPILRLAAPSAMRWPADGSSGGRSAGPAPAPRSPQRALTDARYLRCRRRAGREVDFVIEHGRRLLAVEAKLGASVAFADAEGLRAFLAEHADAVAGLLVHGGRDVRRLGERIVAVPWHVLAGAAAPP
jgi:hypothetical protein